MTGCGNDSPEKEVSQEQEDKKDVSDASEKDEKEDVSEEDGAESLFSEETADEPAEEANPESAAPAERPTSRTVTVKNVTFEETIEYHDDGSYTVTRPLYGDTFSVDCVTTYSKRGEVIGYNMRYYDSQYPDGVDGRHMSFVMGYPVEAIDDDGQVATDCIAEGTTVVNGDKVEMSMFENAGIVLNQNAYANGIAQTLDDFHVRTIYDLPNRTLRSLDISSISDLKWGSEYKDNETLIYAYYDVDCYDTKARKNTTRPVYVSIDDIKYNDKGMVESIETYWTNTESKLVELAPDNLGAVQSEEYVHYTYDSDGNLVREEGRSPSKPYYTYTYVYENGGSGANTGDIVGDWYPTDPDPDLFYHIVLADDGSGSIFRGLDQDSITYTYDGKVLTIKDKYGTADYYFEDGVMCSDMDGAEFIKK